MAHCKHRIMDKCRKNGQPCTFSEKCFEPEEQPTKTNADSLRAMTDEELAGFFSDMAWSGPSDDPAVWLEWMRAPAEGGNKRGAVDKKV